MRLKSIFLLIGLSASVSLLAAQASAHTVAINEAIAHTREAVAAGRSGHPSQLIHHGTEALHSAREAQADHPNVHIKKGIHRLQEGIKFAKKRRSSSTVIMGRALQELERAPH